jgi:tungstate transport system ATP-binding protein
MRAPDPILPLRLEEVAYAPGGTRVLGPVSLTVGAGAPTVVIGPNGSGKSTLLRLMHGLVAPSAGRIAWAGDATARQAMLFQRPVMLRRSALANVTFALARAGVPRAERQARAMEALAAVGLEALADRPARRLSGGEQQRLALARAAVLEPAILFLDEPTASLDPAATRAVEAILARLAAGGVKLVMTTHDLGQARRLAGEVVFLDHGRIGAHAPAPAFFDAPPDSRAAAFLRGDLLA